MELDFFLEYNSTFPLQSRRPVDGPAEQPAKHDLGRRRRHRRGDARLRAPYAEEALGKKLVLQNRPGGSGAVGAAFVLQQPADGYTLLMGAEPQALFRVMDLADFDYDKFYLVNIAAIANNILVVVNNNKPWKTFKELLADVQANPNKVKQYMAGTGSVPFTLSAMVSSQTKWPVTSVPFDGDGPAVAALQGGHIDVGFIASGAVIEHVRAGRLRAIAVLSKTPYQGIAPMTEVLPGLEKFIPWGSFYGVFVRKETPEPVKAKLVAAFKKAGENPKPILLPLILVLSAVGAYAINNSADDVLWMLGFGVFGYFLKMYWYKRWRAVRGAISPAV